MATPYTPVPTPLASTVTLPDDGDLENAASVNVPHGAELDAIAALELPSKNSADSYQLASRVLRRVLCSPLLSDPTLFAVDSGGIPVTLNTSAASVHYPLEVPHGATLNVAFAWIQPGAGHATLPATRPAITLYKVEIATGTFTSIATDSDATSPLATYETYHVLNLFGLSEVVDRTSYRYALRIDAEASTNAHSGCKFGGASIQFTTTAQDPGAA